MGATCFVQPLDLVKNRMQLSGAGGGAKEYKTSFHAIKGIMQKEGIIGMYSGLSAGLLRQATYTTTRLGIYTWLFENFSGLVHVCQLQFSDFYFQLHILKTGNNKLFTRKYFCMYLYTNNNTV